MPDGAGYNEDFYLWAREQAERLRHLGAQGSNLDLDYENLAEEIDSLAKRDRRELRSHLATIFEHMLKLRYSESVQARPGWCGTIARVRRSVSELLDDSPSLRAMLGSISLEAFRNGKADAVAALVAHGETDRAVFLKSSEHDDLIDAALEDDVYPQRLS